MRHHSIFTFEHPQGPQYTIPISVTMQCVINLTVQYFTVYLMLFIAQTVKDFMKYPLPKLTNLMEKAEGTINFCPMLAILFVGTRMRALMITNNKGAPQGWVQDGMYMATWAVLIQLLMVLVVGLSSGMDEKMKIEDSELVSDALRDYEFASCSPWPRTRCSLRSHEGPSPHGGPCVADGSGRDGLLARKALEAC